MNLDKVICPCKKVKRKAIVKAIAKGATSLKAIEKQTGAISKCGKCKKDVKKLIKRLEEA
ncbi:MAG TPA: (2Fe-2S)-binding protein [Tissierellia bacterium]|nr:(2Fe-2S)-binding protein [Tissierellia bacterium]